MQSLPLLLFAFFAVVPFPNEPKGALPNQSSVIRLDVNLVELQATVTDRQGRSVSGVDREAFRLFVDDVLQPIVVFQGEDAPVTAGILLDNSASMASKRSDVVVAALEFARNSNPQDKMFVVHFSDHARFGLPANKPFTGNVLELESAVSDFDLGGTTALYDAINMSLDHLRQAEFGKKVLLVITDGQDNSSHTSMTDVINRAQRESVLIFAVGLFDEEGRTTNGKILTQMAQVTGGQALFPKSPDDITNICTAIAKEIRTQYTFAFLGAEDGKYHRIRVVAADGKNEGLEVHTRAGYFARNP